MGNLEKNQITIDMRKSKTIIDTYLNCSQYLLIQLHGSLLAAKNTPTEITKRVHDVMIVENMGFIPV